MSRITSSYKIFLEVHSFFDKIELILDTPCLNKRNWADIASILHCSIEQSINYKVHLFLKVFARSSLYKNKVLFTKPFQASPSWHQMTYLVFIKSKNTQAKFHSFRRPWSFILDMLLAFKKKNPYLFLAKGRFFLRTWNLVWMLTWSLTSSKFSKGW